MTPTPDKPRGGAHRGRTRTRRDVLRGTALTAAGLAGAGLLGGAAHASRSDRHTGVDTYEHNGKLYVGADPAEPMQNLVTFDNVDGVPTMYIRSGDGVRRPASFRCTPGFLDETVLWVQKLRQLSAAAGYPDLDFITSAGFYVNKTGQHGAGTAIDVDEIGWADGTLSQMIGLDWNSSDAALRRRYYAVDATLRTRFRWTLDRTFNTAHHDHIHSDFGGLPVILGTGSGSDVGGIQAICNEFTNAGLVVDQIWGPLTQGAFDELRSRLGLTSGNPHNTTSVYREILDAVAAHGFAGDPI